MRKTVYLLFLLLLSLRLAAQDDPRLIFQPINDQHASVAAHNQDIEGDIVIPSNVMINGKSYIVTTIADEGFQSSKITSINLPPTLEVIGSSAFFRCLELQGVVLPPSVRDIGTEAFYYCSNLEYILVATENPFYRNVGKMVVDNYDYIIAYPGKGDTVLTIPNSIKGIRLQAISGCQSIKEVYIPSSVQSVGRMAFLFCRELERVQWDASAQEVPGGCFQGCSSLEEVVLSESVTDIGGMAFYGTSLKSITLKGSTPPSFDISSSMSTFENSDYENVVVYVPKGSLVTYRSSEKWGKFKTIIEKEEVENLEWYLITDKNERFKMNTVGMLIATDDSPYFSVLDLNGNVLAEDVLRVHFLKTDPSSVEDILVEKPQNMLKRYVNNQLTLIGASGMVTVYSLSGMEVASALANGQETIIDLSTLPSGTYILKCGNQSFKFMKK